MSPVCFVRPSVRPSVGAGWGINHACFALTLPGAFVLHESKGKRKRKERGSEREGERELCDRHNEMMDGLPVS